MENLYFPLFLGAMAVLVIWLYHKSQKARDKAEDRKYQAQFGQRRKTRPSRPVIRKNPKSKRVAAAGASTSERMWSARHQRAHKVSPGNPSGVPQSKTIQANYIGHSLTEKPGPEENWSVRDQDVNPVDYVGFDEYTAKRRAEAAAKSAREADELSMTAIKFESPDQAVDEKEEGAVKRAGFKP